MNARDFSANALERAAVRAVRFGVPGFKLAGRSAKPEQDAMFLGAFGAFGKGGQREQTAPAHERDGPGAGESLEKETAMQPVIRFAAARTIVYAVHCLMIKPEFGAREKRPKEFTNRNFAILQTLRHEIEGD